MSLPHLTLNHYQEQNFEGTNLQGLSFPGIWHRANFRNVSTGSPSLILRCRQAFTFLLAFCAGFITSYAGATFGILFREPDPKIWLLGLTIGLLLSLFFSITLRSGLNNALSILSFATIFLIVIAVALFDDPNFASFIVMSLIIIGGSIAGSVGLATSITIIQAWFMPIACSIFGLIVGSSFGLPSDLPYSDILWMISLSIPVLSLGSYLGHHTRRQDSRYEILKNLAINLSTWKSTSFQGSDLTAADFTNAKLCFTDFRTATLIRTRWQNSTFQQNNLQGSYLANPIIRHLVTTLDGQGENFDYLDLRGVNLDNAKLMGASFIGANLSNATLKGADLSNAKLAQAQLYGADLSEAILTGAYIENWGISPETQLDSVQCDYIHLRLPTEDNPDPYRKPDNRDETFSANDFTDFIAPILNTLKTYKQRTLSPTPASTLTKTLDLYHREGIDPIAAAISLHELIDQNSPAQIEILSIEGVDKKIRIQANIAILADPSQLNSQYFDRYNQLTTQPNPSLQTLFDTLATQNVRLRSLEAQIAAATDSPLSYSVVPVPSTTSPRRSALQRKLDRLNKAIEQQNQHLDNWEIELEAANNQWTTELDEATRTRLQRQIKQLETNLETGEENLAELEQKLIENQTQS